MVLAINEVPTVNSAELTLTDALAKPVIVVLPADNVVDTLAVPVITVLPALRVVRLSAEDVTAFAPMLVDVILVSAIMDDSLYMHRTLLLILG